MTPDRRRASRPTGQASVDAAVGVGRRAGEGAERDEPARDEVAGRGPSRWATAGSSR